MLTPPSPLRSSLQQFGVSVFSRARASLTASAVSLAQGVPDFDPPPALIEAAASAMRNGFNQYAPSMGLPLLRIAIATHRERRYGVTYDPDTEITVTAGATEGTWSTATALLEPGDEAIIIEPCYETYAPSVVAAGGVVRFVPTAFPDFRLDLDGVRRAFTDRTRLVFLNTPSNPSGNCYTYDELAAVGELCHSYDAYIIADETYEHLTYDGVDHLPVAAVPSCRDRTITVGSASKTFSATGWRIGWALAPAPLTDAVRKVHQFVTFSAPAPLQYAVGSLLVAGFDGYFADLAAAYAARRDILLGYLDGWTISRPAGGYFLIAACGADDDVAWCADLLASAGVAAIPVSEFYRGNRSAGRGLVRFAYCKENATLHEAGRRLAAYREAHR